MTNPTIVIYDAKTGKTIEREMNEEELAQLEIDEAIAIADKEAKRQALATKASLLAKLGITEEEAKLLLGGN